MLSSVNELLSKASTAFKVTQTYVNTVAAFVKVAEASTNRVYLRIEYSNVSPLKWYIPGDNAGSGQNFAYESSGVLELFIERHKTLVQQAFYAQPGNPGLV